MLSPKGGSGKTMVASNLAAALARAVDGSVALVDLDVQFGDAAYALGLVPEHTIGQLAAAPTLDATTLKVFLTRHEPSGAYVLCGAESPEEGETVTDELAARIVELLARDVAYVVVDTPAGLDERTLAVLELATDVVLVSSLDVSSIRNLGKEIDALERVGLLPESRHFVLNRADARVGIEPADVEAALGMKIDAAVAELAGDPPLDEPGAPDRASRSRTRNVGPRADDVRAPVRRPQRDRDRARAQAGLPPPEEGPMKLSERLRDQTAPPTERSVLDFGASRSAADPVAADAVTEMKTRAHEALFARLGLRLFDSTLSQEQLHAYVAQEISDLMASTSAPLSADERQRLVEEIMDDVVGLGPIERFLDDPTISEVMVNATDPSTSSATA